MDDAFYRQIHSNTIMNIEIIIITILVAAALTFLIYTEINE